MPSPIEKARRLATRLLGRETPETEPPVPPTPGEQAWRRTLEDPAFPIGRHAIVGYVSPGFEDGPAASGPALAMMEAIATASKAMESYGGSPRHRPVSVDRISIDWFQLRHQTEDHVLEIGVPGVLDGRWVARDVQAMLRVAATSVVDLALSDEKDGRAAEAMRRLDEIAPLGEALMYALVEDTGAHLTLPSPFGPPEVRQHDIAGRPFLTYAMPDADGYRDLPGAYAVEAWRSRDRTTGLPSLHLSVKRAQSLGMAHRRELDEDATRLLNRGLAYFVPIPRPDPDPLPPRRACALAVLRGRRLLVVREAGSHVFEMPRLEADERGPDREADDARIGARFGVSFSSGAWIARGREWATDADAPDVLVHVYLSTMEGEPASVDGREIHWLDVDAPDRPVSECMIHDLLPDVRETLDRDARDR
jgi:hypothetical protein